MTVMQLTVEDKLLLIIKRILIVNISNARNVFIRIPLKIGIILVALALKLIFGHVYKKQQPLKPPTKSANSKATKPMEQSSPSSISVVLDYSENQSISVNRQSSKSSIGQTISTYSVSKSASRTSLINYFTPDYNLDSLCGSVQEYSGINSAKSTHSLCKSFLNETDLDCDSLESSFYYDPKTQFSDFNSIFSYNQKKDHINEKKSDIQSVQNGLPDLINQKGTKDAPTDKARKYLEGMDGVKFNEIQVPDTLKKQLEYFDRDELLQLIAYQKKYLDFKETRIKDLENYIDNLVVKIIETEPTILMNASNVLTKPKNFI